ncbi:MAG: hypothetical protein IT276_02270 [Ignavibacteriaceae bacterium]|nr:hypothetical protein [Ignavibacterium sp.]MCC6253717.1 hypothetical protein [Ignavibacteriaceae bacterium]HMN26218.1 hypothetical protein [Ignavibacteriaceae bacterium]HRP91586.1 hypothetical protein [Ignavibacteriaceae bacterium]
MYVDANKPAGSYKLVISTKGSSGSGGNAFALPSGFIRTNFKQVNLLRLRK